MLNEKKLEDLEGGNYWCIEGEVSGSFNRFKAKLFNLIEATTPDKTQCDAIKGLIKGFANDEYKICVSNMRFDARSAGFIPEGEDSEIPMNTEVLDILER